jgi:hypothetical protein
VTLKPADVAAHVARLLVEHPIGHGSTGYVTVEPYVHDVFVLGDFDDAIRLRVEFCDKHDAYAEDSLVIRDGKVCPCCADYNHRCIEESRRVRLGTPA